MSTDYSGSQVTPDAAGAAPAFEDPNAATDVAATSLPAAGAVSAAAVDITCVACGMHLLVPAGATYPLDVSCSSCGASWTVT
ncbi:MAG: hypothetical protein NVSMB19_18580 [Vulcanimicrobiaceae bacterium]